MLILFYEQDEHLSIKDIANRVTYSEKQVVCFVRNLFKKGILEKIQRQVNSSINYLFLLALESN